MRLAMVKQDAIDLAVHENVGQLMSNDMLKAFHRSIVRDNDAPFQEFKEPSNPLRDEIRRDVGLLEMKVRAVKNERDPAADVVIELLFEQPVALLGKLCPALRQFFHLCVVIDLEMFGLQHLPVEIRVLDFVAAEVIELRRCGLRQKKEKEEVFGKTSNHSLCAGKLVD